MSIYLISKTPHEDVFHVPILKTYYLSDEIDFSNCDALILTSKEAIASLEAHNPGWVDLPVLAVSSKTADEAKRCGAYIMGVGGGYGDSLLEKVLKHRIYRWLYVRPRIVASSFAEDAKSLGSKLEEKVVYETSCNRGLKPLDLPMNATLIFTSPSAVICFLERHDIQRNQNVVVIGKTTAQALPSFVDYHMAQKPTVEACIELAKELEYGQLRI
jgi:uroporphyrinogen-III synthase